MSKEAESYLLKPEFSALQSFTRRLHPPIAPYFLLFSLYSDADQAEEHLRIRSVGIAYDS